MSLEKMGQSIESNEVKVRLQATPEDVENVKKSVEYSNHLTKANDVLKVLDFPDNIEESFRNILLKQDDRILEELAKKSGKIKQGDLLVTGGGSIGIPYLVPNDQPLYFKDADLLWMKSSGIVEGSFLYNFFISI